MTTPVIVARLFDGKQLVREVPQFYLEIAPDEIQVIDAPPARLRELDKQFENSPSMVPFSVWRRTALGGASILDREEWFMMTPQDPPAFAVVLVEGRPPLVAVRYAEYQLKGRKG